jgi:nitroreductase
MDLFEAMRNRRSVRKFSDKPVPEDVLVQVLEAARCAPSWANTQCWRFVVVQDAAMRKALSETLSPGNPARNAIVTAPITIAGCGVKQVSGYFHGKSTTVLGDWLAFDVALALSQLTLAAHALGLGTVHVGLFDLNRAGELLGVPADVQVVELIPLGWPDQTPKPTPRKPLADLVHRERWTPKA